MSGFSPDWLALREPADHRARNTELQDSVSSFFASRDFDINHPLCMIDLGCGSGSNLRALSEQLPSPQHWVLVDYDGQLLDAAREQISRWADSLCPGNYLSAGRTAQTSKRRLNLKRNRHEITVDFLQANLAQDIEKILAIPHDLVTAAAFFDLVSASWIRRFCHALTAPLYTVLTYNGEESWLPSNPDDQAILDAFHAHQKTEKGFGIAAGPQATEILQRELSQASFSSLIRPSPWTLSQEKDLALMHALAKGTAQAVSQTGRIQEKTLSHWLNQHKLANSCRIGHWDLWAFPD